MFVKMMNLLYVNCISVKTKKTLCFRVGMGMIRDLSPPPFFLQFGSSLPSVAPSLKFGVLDKLQFLISGLRYYRKVTSLSPI